MTTVQQEVNAVITAANERQRAFRAIDLEAQVAAQQESGGTDRQDQAATDPAIPPPGASWQPPAREDLKLEEPRNVEKIALMAAPPRGTAGPNRERKQTSGISMLSPNVRARACVHSRRSRPLSVSLTARHRVFVCSLRWRD